MTIDSTLQAQDGVELDCGKLFTGSGTIQAPKVLIIAQSFEFKGTIECSEECTIVTQHLFNRQIFVQKGNGKFVFDPTLTEKQADRWK